MKSSPTKQELRYLNKIHKAMWIFIGCFGFIAIFAIYIFAGAIIIDEYCTRKALKETKYYGESLIKPPKDLIEVYKNYPDIINENSQPTPYYVEFLRCKLKTSKQLYPFIHSDYEK